jgi:hypothetical protein
LTIEVFSTYSDTYRKTLEAALVAYDPKEL